MMNQPVKTIKEQAWEFDFNYGWRTYKQEADKLVLIEEEIAGDFQDFYYQARPENILNLQHFVSPAYDTPKGTRGRRVWGFRIKFQLNDEFLQLNEPITVQAFHIDKAKAKRLACYKAIKKIQEIGFSPFLPFRVIGLPNYRGHCFVGPFLIPVFNEPFFSRKINKLSKLIRGIKDICPTAARFVELFNKYCIASRYGPMTQKTRPIGIHHKSHLPDYAHLKDDWDSKSEGKNNDLDVDWQMMRLLVAIREENEHFSTPGGSSGQYMFYVLKYIQNELLDIGQSNPLIGAIYSTVKIGYMCSCKRHKFLLTKRLVPFLSIEAYHEDEINLQFIINNLNKFIAHSFNCEQTDEANGQICGKAVETRNILSYEINRLPEMITFQLDGDVHKPKDKYLIKLPDYINFDQNGEKIVYNKYSISYIVQTKFATSPEENEFHTYCVIKGYDKWYEANNIYIIENRSLNDVNHTTGGCLVFYRKKFDEKKLNNYPRFYDVKP